jgi:predicted RNase H-like HicB family nuclease
MRYAVLIEKGKRNYSAFAPDVPGCVATGKTLSEVKQQMKEALAFHFEGMVQHGETVPGATTECCYLDVDVPKVARETRQRRRQSAT